MPLIVVLILENTFWNRIYVFNYIYINSSAFATAFVIKYYFELCQQRYKLSFCNVNIWLFNFVQNLLLAMYEM